MTFQIKNCSVHLNFYFFALACAVAFFDRSGLLLTGLLTALLHEAGHLAVMLVLPGQAPSEVCLTPFGIRIKRRPLSEFARGGIIVLAAGSAVNLTLAAVTAFFAPSFAAVNLAMGLMNLLPVDSLDGGGILKICLCRALDESLAERISTTVSIAVLFGMSFLGIYILFRTRYNFTLLGMSLWLLLSLVVRLLNSINPVERT